MKREIPLFLTAVIGAIVLAGFFVPHPYVSVPADYLQRCAVIVVAFGYALGGANLVQVNLEGILRRHPDWPYKLVLLAGMGVTLVFGLFVDRAKFQDPGTVSLWIYDHVYVPMNSTMFALLALFIASAAFRAFRVRSAEAALLAVSALVVMIGRVPLGDAVMAGVFDHPGLPEWMRHLRLEPLQQWIMDWPQNAAKRAILIGAAMGVMATGLRVILGIERSYLGGSD
ncbi:MAG: hypothetical protein HZA61_07620 [Candidatus Eisenbacteria bacterium]|uniref:Uncharacterized protein n=1 Tax=Eiseniibacteriota bacterium TaxID=2212470 RepID=A0A933SCP0_UNCEI|nr:hypothetical protein [Candidatus Eisenbacteria bacterium]